MFKVVINSCFGGFNPSNDAHRLYADKAGITLFEAGEDEIFGQTNFLTVPEDQLTVEPRDFHDMTLDERMRFHKTYNREHFNLGEVERDDPILVAVVEELGSRANGRFADLKVVELPDDVAGNWSIQEYDGNEHVAESHRSWS